MKKQLSYLLLLASVFAMAGCNNTSGSNDSTNSSTQPSSPSISAGPTFNIPTSIDQIKANIGATKYKGYSFEDNSSKKAKGTVTFNKNEILVKGSATFEDEGSLETSDMLIYKGFDNKTFYDIETYTGKHARKRNIVETVEDENSQILLADAKEELDDVVYNKTWFQDNIYKILVDGATFTSSDKDEFYELTISYTKGHTISKAILDFDENNQLLEGNMTSTVWPSDNFDETKQEPIDPDQAPTSSSTYKATLVLGEDNKEEMTFDVSKYYVTSIDEFYVSSYSDKENNDGKAKAGQYIDLLITKYSPATALNVNEFKIISSSNTSAIEISPLTGSVKAIGSGKSTLTIADPVKSIVVTKEVIVETPSLTAIWISTKNNTINTGDSSSIKIEALPIESTEELEAISSDPSVVEIGEISADRTSLSIKGLKEGTSDITVRSKNNPSMKSKELTITVKNGQAVSTDWLIGTWKNTTTATNEDDELITFNSTFTFNADGSGKVVQKVTGIFYDNEATFNWSYDGTTLKFSSWYSEDRTLSAPTNIKVSEDTATISFTMRSQDNCDTLKPLSIKLVKENEAA